MEKQSENEEEKQYLILMEKILKIDGIKPDRTGVGSKNLFGHMMRFSLEDDKIPLLTTKRTFFKGVFHELIFFLNGRTQTKELEEKGVNIWKGNTSREFLDSRGLQNLEEGDMGKLYGVQWTSFNGVNQLKMVFDSLKNDPFSRRHIVTALNPADYDKGVLLPCHIQFQFFVDNDNGLSLLWNQRSVDLFLGFVFPHTHK